MRSKQEIEQHYRLLLSGGSLLLETDLPLKDNEDVTQNLSDMQTSTVRLATIRAVLGIDKEGIATLPMLSEDNLRMQLGQLSDAINEGERRISEGESVFATSINVASLRIAKEEVLWVLGER